MKKRYNVTLNQETVEKVERILKKANISLSAYLTTLVDEFAWVLDDTGFSEKLENMTMSGAFEMLAHIMKGVESEQKEVQKVDIKKAQEVKKELDSRKAKGPYRKK